MNEIEKMYENAGIKPQKCWQSCNNCNRKTEIRYNEWGEEYFTCERLEMDEAHCPYAKEYYPIFTADKQLGLIKILVRHNKFESVELRFYENDYCVTSVTPAEDNPAVDYVSTGRSKEFSIALADLVVTEWKRLTSTEQEEIRKILK